MTAREAVRTAAGRAAVDNLLKQMENQEQRAPGAAFDFTELRREPGLGQPAAVMPARLRRAEARFRPAPLPATARGSHPIRASAERLDSRGRRVSSVAIIS